MPSVRGKKEVSEYREKAPHLQGVWGMGTWIVLGVLRWNTDGALSLLHAREDRVQKTEQGLELLYRTVLVVPLTCWETCGK